jgi:hypothetical protein
METQPIAIARVIVAAPPPSGSRLLDQILEHHQGVHVAQPSVAKRTGQGTDQRKTIPLPAADAGDVSAHHQVELEGSKSQRSRGLEGVAAELAADAAAPVVLRHPIAGIGDMGTETEGIGPED